MAYRYEQTSNGTDIVIDGWEVGISNSPYQTQQNTNLVAQGISDARCVDLVSVPGEASVAFSTVAMTSNVPLSNVAYTVSSSTSVFTWAGGTSLPNGTAILFTGTLQTPLSSAAAYYVVNSTATTFQVQSFVQPIASTAPVQSLVVAGGGGGATTNHGGGGGAGGLNYSSAHTVSVGSYPITVGGGGGPASNGSNSTFDTTTTNGGGAGGAGGVNGSNGSGGGSGGGGGGGSSTSGNGGSGTASQGHAGGNGGGAGGGGGGASVQGAIGGSTANHGGNGGDGTLNSISGTSVSYAGGGGGAGLTLGGTGGLGGGGTGGTNGSGITSGTANTGGGGGGGDNGQPGGSGGSGVVVIAYPTGSLAATGGTITTSGGMTIHTFNSSGTWTVVNIGVVNITSSGSGTFSAINMSQPAFMKSCTPSNSDIFYFLLDTNGRAWVLDDQYLNNTQQWYYMSNLANETATQYAAGLIPWKGYLFVFDSNSINYIPLQTLTVPNSLAYFTNHANWVDSWKTICPFSLVGHFPLASDNFTSSLFFPNAFLNSNNQFAPCLGLLAEDPGDVFDPTNSSTYALTNDILPLPIGDVGVCLTELGSNLLIGGAKNIVYVWDEFSLNYNNIIRLAEDYTYRMVTVNTTTYFFTGQRGRIYMTNGVNAQLYAKVPDHLSNTVNPYYTWGDAIFNKNQIYFGISATDNSGNAISQYGGLWALDTDTNALRIQNQMSYGTYAGNVTAMTPVVSLPSSTQNLPTSDGYGLYAGWFNAVGGVDQGSSVPYAAGQAYVDSDIIPVGTFLNVATYSNIEFKLTTPLVAGEGVALQYRTNVNSAFSSDPMTAGGNAGDLSGYCSVNFQNVQWIQVRAVLTSTATNPSYCRLKEIRIRA